MDIGTNQYALQVWYVVLKAAYVSVTLAVIINKLVLIRFIENKAEGQ